ncbi:V-type ATP synthase subunit F [Chloroflexota bacterium]
MMPVGHLGIAIVGDEDLVNMMRLAGIRKYHQIEDEGSIGEDVRKVLTELIADTEVSVIAIQEDYVDYVRDLITQVQEAKSLTPVVIEVPSKHGTKYPNAAEYYKAFVSKFVGFEIQI